MIITDEIKKSVDIIIKTLYKDENGGKLDIKSNMEDIVNHLEKVKNYLM